MSYETPGCAYCPPTVRACRQGESEERGPGFCPSKVDGEGLGIGAEGYADPETLRIARASALVESEGYCRWTRVEEICAFARKLGFRKLGIATCISMVDLAKTLSGILESHGFEVASVACKTGGVPKEELGLRDEDKIRPGQHESMCNPVSQAELSTALVRSSTSCSVSASATTASSSDTPRGSPPPLWPRTVSSRTTRSARCSWPIRTSSACGAPIGRQVHRGCRRRGAAMRRRMHSVRCCHEFLP